LHHRSDVVVVADAAAVDIAVVVVVAMFLPLCVHSTSFDVDTEAIHERNR